MKTHKHNRMGLMFCLVLGVSYWAGAATDTLIYNNATYAGYVYPPGASVETFDYGTSAGGLISKFTFGYRNTSGVTGAIYVRFYQGIDPRYCDIGYLVKQITIRNVPATGSGYQLYTYVLPTADRFVLPGGLFGYSIECSSGTAGLALASGGAGQENELWEYNYDTWQWEPFWWGGTPWAGLYMKIYTGPPIDEITCDISGYKFNDQNGNSVWDLSEPAMTGWHFYLDLNQNGVYDASEPNAVTDPNGMYFFENLESPAVYTVREFMKDGWRQTLPGGPDYQYVLNTEPNYVYPDYHFGNTEQVYNASIAGKKFQDTNGNSVQDAGEPGLSNWTIYADANGNNKLDAGELSAGTNTSGNYLLSGLAVGTYTIAEVMKSGWVQTCPTDACTYTVTIDNPDQAVTGINFGNYTFNAYGGGSGTVADPYLISSPLHLQALGAHSWDWNKHFKLTQNIDLNKYKGNQFNLIGRYNYYDQLIPFSGTFDGNGFYISRFTYTYTDIRQEYIGLFGYVHGAAAEIRNVKLYHVKIDTQGSGVDSGALVGWLRSGTLSNCRAAIGSVTVDKWGAAGLVGQIDEGTVTGCSANLDVASLQYCAGGITALNDEGTISNCSFQGTVTGQQEVGGLVGQNQGQINRCYADAAVDGFQHVGGLAGENSYEGIISECYSLGTVVTHTDPRYGLAGNEAGGFVGRNLDGDILNCYSAASVSSVQKVGGFAGLAWGDTLNSSSITNCYAVGAVSGSAAVGGFVGLNSDDLTALDGCLWDTQTTGRNTSDGGIGKTTWQMQNQGTFDYLGWDFSTPLWSICPATGYPVLGWQPCQSGPGGVMLKWSAMEGGNIYDYSKRVLVDPDGNILAAGSKYLERQPQSNWDLMVIKYTPEGQKLWLQTYDSDPAGDLNDRTVDMALDADGNIYLTGTAGGDILTVKYNSDGILQWAEIYNGNMNLNDRPTAITVDTAGNTYVAGQAYMVTGGQNYCLLKYLPDGTLDWDRTYNGTANRPDIALDVCTDTEGNIYVTGESENPDYTDNVVTLKYDSQGTRLWEKVYACPEDGYLYLPQDGSKAMAVDSQNCIYVSGGLEQNDQEDCFLLKYNSDGTLLWPLVFDIAGTESGVNVIVLDDQDHIYLAGGMYTPQTNLDYAVAKLNPDGQILWSQSLAGPANKRDYVIDMAVDPSHNVYLTGLMDHQFQEYDAYIVTLKYNPYGNLLWSAKQKSKDNLIDLPSGIAVSGNQVYVVADMPGIWIDSDCGILAYAQCSYPGDGNQDHQVDMADLALTAGQWLRSACGECQKADWSGDENVHLEDLIVIAEFWLEGTALPPAVCEYCKADFDSPEGVGMEDFAFLSGCWLSMDSGCVKADLIRDSLIDLSDMVRFCEYWLMGR